MPIYCFTCEECDETHDLHRPMESRDEPADCPACGNPMARDRAAELGGVQTDWTHPILSEAAGVAPEQVAEARRVNKDHKYTDDGRMIFTSKKHRQKCLRDIGMVDRDGFD